MSTKQTTPPTSPPKSPAHGQKLKAMDFDSELLPFHVDLSGKVAAVTGGGGILCGHMCRVLAACGAKVRSNPASQLPRCCTAAGTRRSSAAEDLER